MSKQTLTKKERLLQVKQQLIVIDGCLDAIDKIDPYGDIVENFCEEDKSTRHTTRILEMIQQDLLKL